MLTCDDAVDAFALQLADKELRCLRVAICGLTVRTGGGALAAICEGREGGLWQPAL